MSLQLQCQLCDRMFTNFYHLDEHLKESCNGRRQEQASPSSSLAKPLEYHCTHCAKQSLKHVFASLQALEQHVSHMHSGKGRCNDSLLALCMYSILNEQQVYYMYFVVKFVICQTLYRV